MHISSFPDPVRNEENVTDEKSYCIAALNHYYSGIRVIPFIAGFS